MLWTMSTFFSISACCILSLDLLMDLKENYSLSLKK